MSELWLQQVENWREFYLLVGSAGGALVGLMFVVVALGPQVMTLKPQGEQAVRAFYTPIIFSFTTSLVISGFMMTPGLTSAVLGPALAGIGLIGLIYQFRSRAHTRWRESKLPWVDLAWYVSLPLLGHALVLAAALEIWWWRGMLGLYAVAAGALLLVIAGIRNAWDLVLYIAERPRG